MKVHPISQNSLPAVADLMARTIPRFWSAESAGEQLSRLTGWYLADEEGHPAGWLAALHLPGYRTVEVETLCHANGTVCPELTPLLEACESWARELGAANLRFTMGSRGTSLHERKLGEPWQELRDLATPNRPEYCWWVSNGFRASGILPGIYGPNWHGILLVKEL